MKIFFHYYKALHAFNLPFSLFTAAALASGELSFFFAIFFFCYVLAGLGLAVYFFWLRYPAQYYFYHNRGWSKVRLIGTCFLVNFGLYLIYCFSKPFLYGP